jgi:lipid II:glycine glycyltransferase (peptidoglycan interpeptide bridge formation enzyme)
MISIVPYIEKEHSDIWEFILSRNQDASFLSSLAWIKFQSTQGKVQEQFLIKKDEQFVGTFYIELFHRRISRYAYAPYSPVLTPEVLEDKDILEEVFASLADFSKSYLSTKGINYLKIDPFDRYQFKPYLENAGWGRGFSIGQAKDTWIFDLETFAADNKLDMKDTKESEVEEKLLSEYKKDTRYYVKRARKKGVYIKRVVDSKGVEDFIKLTNETKARQGFENFGESYYRDQWTHFHDKKEGEQSIAHLQSIHKMCEIYLAYVDVDGAPVPLAGALMNVFNGWFNYAHGASTSDPKLAKLAAPYLLHFEIMKLAISNGYRFYNFWGVIPKGVEHYGRGFSSFKMKFPGEMVQNSGVWQVQKKWSPRNWLNQVYDWWVYRDERY